MGKKQEDALRWDESDELAYSSEHPASDRESHWRTIVAEQRHFVGDPNLGLEFCKHARFKGETVSHRARFIFERYGQEALELVAATVPPGCRDLLLKPPLAFEWVPSGDLIALDYSLLLGPMTERYSEMHRLGYEIAGYDLSFRYRVLLRIGSPEFIVGQSNRALRAYFRPGTVEVLELSSGHARLRFLGPVPRYLCTYVMPGWITRAIELSGGSRIDCRHIRCQHTGGKHCEWRLSWG